MNDDITDWLKHRDVTMDSSVEAPRGLFDRLRFVADLLKSIKKVPTQAALIRRDQREVIHVTVIGPGITVGRMAPCELVISDARLSHEHFRITAHESGHVIRDLNSRNGTWVNGHRATAAPLKDGDIIEAGGHAFVFLDSHGK